MRGQFRVLFLPPFPFPPFIVARGGERKAGLQQRQERDAACRAMLTEEARQTRLQQRNAACRAMVAEEARQTRLQQKDAANREPR